MLNNVRYHESYLHGITRVAANEWGEDGINVNNISLTALTEGVEKWRENFPDLYKDTINKIPMKRMGNPEKDIGRIAVFLASEDADFITGQTIMSDGGSTKL
ncbi:SDR family oxidoreductase [Virgibacillus sp. SK37]|uniref:SDR family oxidoreductase n=1 Tax=Virgibacillus sp. SK37 TaxID=403957 RepID=UPI000694D530